MSEQSSRALDAMNRIAAKLSTPLAMAGARIILTLLTLICGYMATQFNKVVTKTEDVDRRLLIIETSRAESIRNFTRRLDEAEAQNRRESDSQAELQNDVSSIDAKVNALVLGVQRIERFIDSQQRANR